MTWRLSPKTSMFCQSTPFWANVRTGWSGTARGSEQGLEFPPDDAQGVVVLEELGVHLGEFFQDLGLSGQKFALLDERPDDMHAHFHRLRAVEDIRCHERAVLGEGIGKETRVAMALVTGRNLRPVPCIRLIFCAF